MSDAALFEDTAFDAGEQLDDEFESFDLADEFDELEEFDAHEDLGEDFDALDGFDEWDEVGEFDADLFADDGLDDLADEFGDFAFDADSGLFMPGGAGLVSGPAAVRMMQMLNPAVLDSLDADEADSFFGRMGGFLGKMVKRAAPFIRRALPAVQKIAGFAGPWGRLVSAGLGGVQGLMDGKGWKGALQGAVGGLVPGGAGKALGGLLGGVMGGDGADDDAAVDAMADWADAHHGHHVAAARAARTIHPARAAHAIHAAHAARAARAHTAHALRPSAPVRHHAQAVRIHRGVALPIGAGLTTRAVARHVLGRALRHASGRPLTLSHLPALMPQLQRVERIFLRAANAVPGTTGRKLRAIRHIGHQVAHTIARQGAASPAAVARALPSVVQTVVKRTVPRIVSSPTVLVRTPAVARKRVVARRRILKKIPIEILFRAHIVRRAA